MTSTDEKDVFSSVLLIIPAYIMNFVKMVHFFAMKTKLEKLFDDINASFDEETAKSFLESAKNRSRNIFMALTLPTIPILIFGYINMLFTDKSVMPIYKPESLRHDLVATIFFWLLQCGSSLYNFAAQITFNMILICLLIYLQEYSKFLGERFVAINASDVKTCVERHVRFKKLVFV